jgi:hypothetical protein
MTFDLELENKDGEFYHYASYKTAKAAWKAADKMDCDFAVYEYGRRITFDKHGNELRI